MTAPTCGCEELWPSGVDRSGCWWHERDELLTDVGAWEISGEPVSGVDRWNGVRPGERHMERLRGNSGTTREMA